MAYIIKDEMEPTLPKFDASATQPPPARPRAGVFILVAGAVLLIVGGATAVFTLGSSREPPRRVEASAVPTYRAIADGPLRATLDEAKGALAAAAQQVDEAMDSANAATDTALSAQIKARFGAVKLCYERALKSAQPGLSGRYNVEFTIAKSGNVTAAKIKSDTVGDRDMVACVLSKVRAWRFTMPAGVGPITINYPIHFRAPR